MVYEPLYCRVIVACPHVQETVGIGLDAELAVELERGGGEAGVVVELAGGAVGESVSDVSVDVGKGNRASAWVEVVSGVDSVGFFPNEPEAVDVIACACS